MSQQDDFMHEVQKHFGIIQKIVYLYADHEEDQKDLRQEIILQAWKSFKRFKRQSSFSTWLYKVSINTALTYLRSQNKRREVSFPDLFDTRVPEQSFSDQSALLWMSIKQLNEVDRIIITLHLEGYSNEEVAEIIGIRKNHLAVKLHRIKKDLEAFVRKLEKQI